MLKARCSWVNIINPLYVRYHDQEWGVPEHDDNRLFEMLILEGAQAGLSWETVLNKRENYRIAFDNFIPMTVAQYSKNKSLELLENKGIIRNKLKIRAAIQNAKVFLSIQSEHGSFGDYIWQFIGNQSIQNHWSCSKQIPRKNDISDAIAYDLKKRGMNFVGSTIIYSFMQAVGMVNDHETHCFRHKELNWSG